MHAILNSIKAVQSMAGRLEGWEAGRQLKAFNPCSTQAVSMIAMPSEFCTPW